MTEQIGSAGTVFYDHTCHFCRRTMLLVGPLFRRRGFAWAPFPATAASRPSNAPLSSQDPMLVPEMKLQLPGGPILGGVDAWIHLLRSVWWLWPFAIILALPGFNACARAGYRWIARNRYCFGGTCPVQHPVRHRRKIPFLDLP